MLCYVILFYVILDYVMLCFVDLMYLFCFHFRFWFYSRSILSHPSPSDWFLYLRSHECLFYVVLILFSFISIVLISLPFLFFLWLRGRPLIMSPNFRQFFTPPLPPLSTTV